MAFNFGAFLSSLAPAAVQSFEYVRKLREEKEKRAQAEALAATLGGWLKSLGWDVQDPRVLAGAIAQRPPDVVQLGKIMQETATARRQEEYNRRLAELLTGGIDIAGLSTATSLPSAPTPGVGPLLRPEPALEAAGLDQAATLGEALSISAPSSRLSPVAPDEMAKLTAERDRIQRAMTLAVQAGNVHVANLLERRLGDVEKALEALNTRERTREWFLEYAQRRQQLQAAGIRPEEAARVAAIDTSVFLGFLPQQLQQLFPTKETLDDAIRAYAEKLAEGDPEKFLRAVGMAKAMMLPSESPSPGERERLAHHAALAGQLQRMAELFRTDYIGPIAGRIRGWQESLIGLPPEESEFRSTVEQFRQSMVTALTGAQRSAKEIEILLQIFPDVNLPASTFVGRLNQAVQYTARLLRETRELWRQSRIDTYNLDRVLDALSVRVHLTDDGRLAIVKAVKD